MAFRVWRDWLSPLADLWRRARRRQEGRWGGRAGGEPAAGERCWGLGQGVAVGARAESRVTSRWGAQVPGLGRHLPLGRRLSAVQDVVVAFRDSWGPHRAAWLPEMKVLFSWFSETGLQSQAATSSCLYLYD